MTSCIYNTLRLYSLPVYSEYCAQDESEAADIAISWQQFWEALMLNLRTESNSFAVYERRKMKGEEISLLNKKEDNNKKEN